MRRGIPLGVFAGVFTLLVVITFLNKPGPQRTTQKEDDQEWTAEKEKIRSFWEIYRKATENRISGKPGEAAGEYQRALALNDKHEDALYYLGNMHMELGEYENAKEAWKRLVQVNPTSTRAHLQLGNLYLRFEQNEIFNIEKAESEFQKVLRINKEETGPLIRLGQVLLIRGDLSEAQFYFDAVTASNYQSAEAYFLNGYVAWRKGDSKKALDLLQKAVKYSHPPEPVEGTSGEGDTRTGKPLGVLERSAGQSLFYGQTRELSRLVEISVPQEVEDRYRKLEEFLSQIRKKIRSQPQ
ncbi:MAG: tetratricopeptide repeat protein [Candidatus Neomarinimicrobiota bacterium]